MAVYTSGKGSSAAGLTASVIRDNSSVSSFLRFCTSRIVVFRFILPFTKSYYCENFPFYFGMKTSLISVFLLNPARVLS